MKKVLTLSITVFIIVFGYAQESPILKVGKQELGLSSLDIKVDIVGNIATTTYDMFFYNPTNSVLEGELSFPLGEGHDVSRFALEVNGKLREAVVVEKELGRIAFENVVRRGVDPALLEKGTGNNYKARIYPIPSNGYKRVLLAYEQELVFNENAHAYNLPLNFKNKLKVFKLHISVFDQKYEPVIEKNGVPGLKFSNWNKNYTTKIKKNNYVADKPLLIQIPLSVDAEKVLTSDNYFFIYKTLAPKNKFREKPNNITIYWDASLSMQGRELEKEFALLDQYFSYLNTIDVRLIVFSNAVLTDKKLSIKNGNWKTLKKELERTIYDGGTNYEVISTIGREADASLLFTDGMLTLSDLEFTNNTPVFIINSVLKSNHSALKRVSEKTNGSYINLQTDAISEAISKIKFEPYKFLGYESSNKNLDVYPVSPVSVTNDFSMSGKYMTSSETIILKFGYANEVLERIPITIEPQSNEYKDVGRFWAQKKLNNLNIDAKKNKHQITQLGTAYSLVTKYTSLIVLEDVRDYIRYQITPSDELLEEYNRLLAQQKEKNISPPVARERTMNFSTSDRITERISPAPQMMRMMNDEVEVLEDQVMIVEDIPMTERIELNEMVETEEVVDDVPFSIIEEVPVYPGCQGDQEAKKKCFSDRIKEHFDQHFNSELGNTLNLSQGRHRIYALFTINRRGNVTNIRIRAPHRKLEDEARRVLRMLPKMIPGKQRNRPVSVKYVLPIAISVNANGEAGTVNLEPYVVTPVQQANSYKKYTGELKVKDRRFSTVYLAELGKVLDKEDAYRIYLGQRNEYLEKPAYFVDVAKYFKDSYKDDLYSSRILSNIAEMDFNNYELLKVFAYQLQANHNDELAIFIFKQILELRPEDSQSYRDLAIAYQNVGKCQEALDLFNSIITGEIYKNSHRRIFKGIEDIAKNEIKYLIQKYKDDLDVSKVDKQLLDSVDYDIRVTVDWNHNDTDIDLHIIDPNLEECFYSHSRTAIGGSMSKDMTQGFGPEEFTLVNAIKGEYFVKIKYYGDRYQKVENPTFMKVTMFKRYGTAKETKETQIIRLTKNDDEEIIAKFVF